MNYRDSDKTKRILNETRTKNERATEAHQQ